MRPANGAEASELIEQIKQGAEMNNKRASTGSSRQQRKR